MELRSHLRRKQTLSCLELSFGLESLPAELLVRVFSFLSSRDRMKLRYVSRRMKMISETPLLWKKFLWPQYDKREERSLNNVLRACGAHVKALSFPTHVTPSAALRMFKHCRNVTHLTIGTQFCVNQLEKALGWMKTLQKVEIKWELFSIEHLLITCQNLEDLTLQVNEKCDFFYYHWLCGWVSHGFKPRNLNIVTKVYYPCLVAVLFLNRSEWNAQIQPGRTAHLKLFYSLRVPLNVSIAMPQFQLDFGQRTALPVVKASKFGILGIEHDLLLLTDAYCNGEVGHKARVLLLNEQTLSSLSEQVDSSNEHLIFSVQSLSFVTHFDLSQCRMLRSGHLEQIAIACPNLQQLNLEGNCECLKSLQGLQSVTSPCSLRGLNLFGIHVETIENRLKLWKTLSGIKHLTYLAVELCVIKSCRDDNEYKQQLGQLFHKCNSLQVLETNGGPCSICDLVCCDFTYTSRLSHFQSLSCYKSSNSYATVVDDIIANCKHLQYLSYHTMEGISFTSAHNQYLRELCIEAEHGDIVEAFMDTVSAHGRLERVILSVRSVTSTGIDIVISNSPKLLVFHVYLIETVLNERGVAINLKVLKSSLKKRFSHRKLFHLDGLTILHGKKLCHYQHALLEQGTELFSIWKHGHTLV